MGENYYSRNFNYVNSETIYIILSKPYEQSDYYMFPINNSFTEYLHITKQDLSIAKNNLAFEK